MRLLGETILRLLLFKEPARCRFRKTVQFGWPLGMPLVRKLDTDLWEVRIRLPDRIARVLFTTGAGRMILLHGFIKKSQKAPQEELALAKTRL